MFVAATAVLPFGSLLLRSGPACPARGGAPSL